MSAGTDAILANAAKALPLVRSGFITARREAAARAGFQDPDSPNSDAMVFALLGTVPHEDVDDAS